MGDWVGWAKTLHKWEEWKNQFWTINFYLKLIVAFAGVIIYSLHNTLFYMLIAFYWMNAVFL